MGGDCVMAFHRGTMSQFTAWHGPIKVTEGITETGRVGRKNGRLAPDSQRTTAYSKAYQNPSLADDYIWTFGNYEDRDFDNLTERQVRDAGWFADSADMFE